MHADLELKRERVADLCRRFGVLRLDVFGSAVREDFDPERSDFDLLVRLEDVPPIEYSRRYFDLKEALERLFGRRVDLVTEPSLENPFFKARVLGERQPIYAR